MLRVSPVNKYAQSAGNKKIPRRFVLLKEKDYQCSPINARGISGVGNFRQIQFSPSLIIFDHLFFKSIVAFLNDKK